MQFLPVRRPVCRYVSESTVSVEKRQAEMYLFSLEIEKTRVIVKNGAIVKIGVHFFFEPRHIERWVVEGAEDDITV